MTESVREPRIREIANVVDDMIKRIVRWSEDAAGPQVMPEEIEISIKAAEVVCRAGDIPQCCQHLVTACSQLRLEFERYDAQEHGAYRAENGSPGPQFWNAVKKVIQARRGSEQPHIEATEPVYVLAKQNVGFEQIAHHIYGFRGQGPFLTNGVADYALIQKEIDKPGSVLDGDGTGWIAPWKKNANQQKLAELSTQLSAIDFLIDGKSDYEDPGTIEDMLRDKCYIQQIMAGKHVTRAKVLEVAKQAGLPAIDRPGAKIEPQGPIEPEEPAGRRPKKKLQNGALRDALLEEWSMDPAIEPPEMAKRLRKRGFECPASQAGQLMAAEAQRRREEETEQ